MTTRKQIMQHIEANDSRAVGVDLYAGRGYFYFGTASGVCGSIADRFTNPSVMTNTLNALTADEWLFEFVSKADDVGNI